MALSTKPGNGGHGLEAYDDTTGKYASVSFDYNGKTISSWEELKDAILEENPQYKAQYESNPQIAEQFDNYVQDQIYPQMFQSEVDKLNAEEANYIEFSSPEDAGANFHKLFNDRLINNLLDNNILDSDRIQVNPYKTDYVVSTWAACMQMTRYKGNNRAKPISAQEYMDRTKNFPKSSLEYWSSNQDLKNYVASADEVPLLRNQGIRNEAVWKEVKRSYWDPNSNINSLLAHAGGKNCSYFGSVIYFSTGEYSYDSSITGHRIMGIAKPKEMKLLSISSHYDGCKEANDFLMAYENNRSVIDSEIQQKLVNTGRVTPQQAEEITQSLYNQIKRGGNRGDNADWGLIGMIMGYDAILGEGYQFDILNPNKIEVVKD